MLFKPEADPDDNDFEGPHWHLVVAADGDARALGQQRQQHRHPPEPPDHWPLEPRQNTQETKNLGVKRIARARTLTTFEQTTNRTSY